MMSKTPVSVFLLLLFCVLSGFCMFCHGIENNTLIKSQEIKDGESLISRGEIFELGFFSPENSTLRYLGIWYYNIEPQTLVWVANRETPISNTTGILTIGDDGNLVVVSSENQVQIWSSNASTSILSDNSIAILDDNGNLILSSNDSIGDTNKAYWQSFENPGDTYLPHMRVNVSSVMGENRAFTSWKSANDPSPGNFMLGLDSRGSPQIVLWEGSRRRWRSGHWNSQIFIGIPNMTLTANYLYGFKLTNEGNGNIYLTYIPANSSSLVRFHLTWDGFEEQQSWDEDSKEWNKLSTQPSNDCGIYNFCGNYSICSNAESPKCRCMDGFESTYPDQWAKGNWTGGCQRRTKLQCQRNNSEGDAIDGFKGLLNVNLPDFADLMSLASSESCKDKCLANCSCMGYAEVSLVGCMIWTLELVDIQQFVEGGSSLFVRLADSELGAGKRKLTRPLIIVIVVAAVLLLGTIVWLLLRLKEKMKVLPASAPVVPATKSENPVLEVSRGYSTDLSGPADVSFDVCENNGPDLPIYSFDAVLAATGNFSEKNKLGQGGFGPVYKGTLFGGHEVAVKRLSRKSGQGLEEFKNEIILIAKLQHRNLVRLLGCCIMREEKILIYEYMSNKSLDLFIFDPVQQPLLDWNKRFTIISGIARGLLYLHRDSRLRIIHRDLKTSNILLDEDMNPKISDFGMARIFGVSQNEANTNRVVGTYGYMAPEYAMEGLFSVKSDVYSFGVLLLEILSGKKNSRFWLTENLTLVAHAWDLWSEGKAMELIDPTIRVSSPASETSRCLHIAMLCVQDSANLRPTMSSVLLMLESESATLPVPRQPTYSSMRSSIEPDILMEYQESQEIVSSKELTGTILVGR